MSLTTKLKTGINSTSAAEKAASSSDSQRFQGLLELTN